MACLEYPAAWIHYLAQRTNKHISIKPKYCLQAMQRKYDSFWKYICMWYVCACPHVHACTQYTYGGERTTFRSQFISSTTRILGIELWLLGLAQRTFPRQKVEILLWLVRVYYGTDTRKKIPQIFLNVLETETLQVLTFLLLGVYF